MDILKIAIDWAKAELVSTSFFILCGIIFLSFPFAYSLRKIWQLRQDFEWLSCFFLLMDSARDILSDPKQILSSSEPTIPVAPVMIAFIFKVRIV